MQNEHANLNDDSTSTPSAPSQLPDDLPPDSVQAEEILSELAPAPEVSAFAVDTAIDVVEAKRALEAVLLSASEPMAVNELKKIFDGELSADTVRNLLEELREEWTGRSVELALVASGYRFRVKPDYQKYLDRLSNEKPPRYSRAVLETMAIIAYRQPVTRGDIEDIRGVAVSPHILKTLEDRGWIDEIGHKDAPGRPALFATTKHFLDDLNLLSLDELPPLHELQATLDMSQAGAALSAGETPALPGVDRDVGSNAEAGATAAVNDADLSAELPGDAHDGPADPSLSTPPNPAEPTGAPS